MKDGYYKYTDILDRYIEKDNPLRDDCVKILRIISGDAALSRYFYKNNNNPNWLELLREAGQFKDVPMAVKEGTAICYKLWPQTKYLVRIASEKPAEVFDIIKDFDTDEFYVMRDCITAIQSMPIDIAIQAIPLIKRLLKYERGDWHFVGKEVAELMVQFAQAGYADRAFEIANIMLQVRVKKDTYSSSWHNLVGRYSLHEYEYYELMFNYYKQIWKIKPLRAGTNLIDILDAQIEIDQNVKRNEKISEAVQKKHEEVFGKSDEDEDFDYTEHSYILMPKIEGIEDDRSAIANILIGGIRAIGEYILKEEKNYEKADEFIQYLQSKGWAIFKRIEIYLMRYAPDDERWNKRIIEIINNVEKYTNRNYNNEYKSLLNEKYEMLKEKGGEAKDVYLEWVEKQGEIKDIKRYEDWFREQNNQPPTPKDIEEYKNYRKAQALYCIKDREPKLYDSYTQQSGKADEEIKPRSAIEIKTEWAATPEKSPFKLEEMRGLEPVEVIGRVLELDAKIPDDEEERHWDLDVKEALANAFKLDVIERAGEYIKVDADLIVCLGRRYIRNFFYGLNEAINTKKLEDPNWELILEIAQLFVKKKGVDKVYNATGQAIPSILERGFKMDTCKLPTDEKIISMVWEILTGLLGHDDDADVEDDGDPLGGCINCVQGVVFENIIRFGLFCKNDAPKLFASSYAKRFRDTLQHVIDNIEKVKIRCVFGVFFSNLCWIDEDWMKENLDRIFPEDNERQWDAVWGSYVYWSRASKLSFELAGDKYAYAIERIGQEKKFENGKDMDSKLVDHLMLAYLQGWMVDDALLNQFFEKDEDDLLAKASHFMSSAFGYLKMHKKDEWRKGLERRLLAYWRGRYEKIRKNPNDHQMEAEEFTSWVKDSPFEPSVTFNILEKSLKLTGGQAGRMSKFIEGVCEIGQGYELRALKLLNQSLVNSKEPDGFRHKIEEIEKFMEHILGLRNDYEDISEIKTEAIHLADTFGRMGEDRFRSAYNRLNE